MKLLLGILLILMSVNVIAEEKLFETKININTTTNSVRITTENSDYEYNCNDNRSVEKVISFRRNVDCVSQSCSNELNNLSATCTKVVNKIDEIFKDSKSYSQLYIDCTNQKATLESKGQYETKYNDCVKEKETAQTSIVALNKDISDKNSILNECNTEKLKLKNIEDKNKNNTLYLIGAFIGGFAAAYYYFVKRKTPKTTRQEVMGEDEDR